MMFRCENQLNDRGLNFFPNTSLAHEPFGKFRALLFIVSRTGVVDRIMKPNAKFNGARFTCNSDGRIKLVEAIRNVLEIMIVPMWFRIELYESLIPTHRFACGTAAEFIPSFLIQLSQGCFSRTFW